MPCRYGHFDKLSDRSAPAGEPIKPLGTAAVWLVSLSNHWGPQQSGW